MVPGLQFFNFAGDADGEDIKLEFKKRITEAEILLTRAEKEDIITEAEYIFKFMLEIVSDLDRVMAARKENIMAIGESRPLSASRDSGTVAHERLSKRKKASLARQQNQRKPSYLEILVDGPVAKLIQFRGTFPTWNVVNPLGKRYSKEERGSETSRESESSAKDGWHSESLWTKWLTSLVPMVLCIVLGSWYYGTYRNE
jgi:hypothetical protein